ncbi:MAG: TIGR03564 family F420-dependent LLM class oxidoreductase [Pseudomonadales bacterium]|jgi:5,10-methylenetetrahydromethanopterin reductase|nr:TIGR03564 family F420-dependent LLM class oxidoreductase [Pseudomonadales bacterium]MCP5320251.1 TIGR03564 family F420-dependent LLM class oxidoreductase [Pseudomonadales bacterium]MCP5337798.1 TIGR03564 family F420-dependent LLM class oxidoreductase [Pseudomonadales bacterium]
MRIGIGLSAVMGAEGALDEIIGRVRKAEADGFDSAWMSHIFGPDAITLLALAGRETRRIELGTFVVPTWPRHPSALAQQALTASAASSGRFTLGIGLSHRIVIENMLGLDYARPAHHMREYLSVLIPLLEKREVSFRGEEFKVALQLRMSGMPRPKVLVAALGPRMLQLAGELTDGTATWMGGPKYLAGTAVPAIRAAAAKAGRGAPRIVAGFPVAVTRDARATRAARASAAETFAAYGQLPSYRAVLDIEGAAEPADIAIIGSAAEVRSQFEALAAAGVTDLNALPFAVDGDPHVMMRTYEFLAEAARSGV